MTKWDRFWTWYKTKIAINLVFLLVIHLLQIPHMIWAADLYFTSGYISNVNPVLDFALYGIDLLELGSLATIITNIYAYGIYGRRNV